MAERKPEYPNLKSKVTVVFTDGEVKEYEISAGAGISIHLAQQCGETGILVLLNRNITTNIPVAQIKEYQIEQLPAESISGGA